MSDKFDLFSDYSCELGEGPFWDPKSNGLLWVDIIGQTVLRQSYDQTGPKVINVTGNPGCVVLSNEGEVIAGINNSIAVIDGNGSPLKVLAETNEGSGLRFNDGKCDPSGRFWVGSMDRNEKAPLGSLYSWRKSEGLVEREKGVTVSNGMGWSPEQDLFYYIDSPTRQVCSYDFDPSTGSIINKRQLIKFSEEDGFPDGMTLDIDGRLWIAFWGGAKIMCVNPDSKAIEEVVNFPVSKITSCAFGGDKLDQLFVTSAKVDVNEEDEPLAGKTFIFSPGVSGAPSVYLA